MNEPRQKARLRWFEYVMALLPFTLAFTGVIGMAVGPAACAINLKIMQSARRRAVKIGAALGVALLAVILWELACYVMI